MYGEDLAYIHDQGYSLEAEQAASYIIGLLRSNGFKRGHILDIGCGSGRSTAVFAKAGYDVVGMDRSPAMIRLAKSRVPGITFTDSSVFTHSAVPYDAIVAIGEVVNYLPSRLALRQMMHWAFSALRPGGRFVFDIRTVPRAGHPLAWANGRTGKDWAVIASSCIDPHTQRLVRTITSFRKVRGRWRRSQEIHRQQLYQPLVFQCWLRRIGFHVQLRCGYGQTPISPQNRVILARKPSSQTR